MIADFRLTADALGCVDQPGARRLARRLRAFIGRYEAARAANR